MPNHPSHDERQQELRRELRRRGLPPAYVERFISELDDHYANLVEQRRISMGAARKLQSIEDDQSELQQRIGEPTKLALFAAEQYRARSFWGMHAWVAYLVGPLPLYIAMWMLYLVSVWLPTYCIGTLGERMGWWTQSGMALAAANYLVTQAVVLTCFTWGLLVLPPIGAALSSAVSIAATHSIGGGPSSVVHCWRLSWPLFMCLGRCRWGPAQRTTDS